MALVDALLQIGRDWDEIESQVGERVADDVTALLIRRDRNDPSDRAARVFETLAPRLSDDSSVFAARERRSDRSALFDDAVTYVLVDGLPRNLASIADSVEEFALRVLADRLVAARSIVRRAARHRTLDSLTSAAQSGGRGSGSLLIAALQPPVRHAAPTRVLYRGAGALAFNPEEAFLQLPTNMQSITLALVTTQSPTSVVPAFQFSDGAALIESAAATNAILRSRTDPWGAGSWWTRPNGYLQAVPIDLLGTDREPELASAADTLGQDYF